jgi:ribonucleoside-diphosphate reductase alpha chain
MREDVLKKRYYLKDAEGNVIEDWASLCDRVARAVAETEEDFQEFRKVLYDRLFLPNSPALTNAGSEGFSLSACFVLPVPDSMDGIFEAVKQAALIQKAGGGTGFSFSSLRPAGDTVGSTKGVASGPCSFIFAFDMATEVTRQGGTRRGANMGALRVDHPDVLNFIALKSEEGKLPNFNLSVALTDAFMEALRSDKEFPLVFKGEVRKWIRVREIWDALIDNAWKNGEPGVIFLDRINQANPTPHLGEIEGSNPCGEVPLLPYEACVLGSVNLSQMLKDGDIDWQKLGETVRTGVRFLDRVIDIQHYPLPEIERIHKGNRKIGLGVMGWADLLIKLQIPYGTEKAVELANTLMRFISETSCEASRQLAQDKGVFPNWEGSTWQEAGFRMRNATTTAIAPTGSISIIAGCSSGIEPNFDFRTIEKRTGEEFEVFHPLYEEFLKGGSKTLPPWFVKASDIPVEWHIRMQGAFQKHVHNAVSKTINMLKEASREDVEKAFLLAYQLGCKGITIYRDGSRKEQVISSLSSSPGLPAVLDGKRICIETSEGKVYVNISFLFEKPQEVFISTPVETKYAEVYESFARVFSVALRYGVPLKKLITQLERANARYGSVVSVPYSLVRAFRLLGFDGTAEKCPDCGGALILEEGCIKCHSCGFTKC